MIRAYERHWFRLSQELREVREANVFIVADRAKLTSDVARLTSEVAHAEEQLAPLREANARLAAEHAEFAVEAARLAAHQSLVWRVARWLWHRLPLRARRAIRG